MASTQQASSRAIAARPLGTYDKQLWQEQSAFRAINIVFQPGVNEELAATAVWGSQQVGLFPGGPL